MAFTCGTLPTQPQRPLEARPVVHAPQQPLEVGPFLLYGRQLELREGRSLTPAKSSTWNARDTGRYERQGRTNAQGHPGRTPQSVSGRRGNGRVRNRGARQGQEQKAFKWQDGESGQSRRAGLEHLVSLLSVSAKGLAR